VIRQATVNWISNAGENAIDGDNDDTQQRLQWRRWRQW